MGGAGHVNYQAMQKLTVKRLIKALHASEDVCLAEKSNNAFITAHFLISCRCQVHVF